MLTLTERHVDYLRYVSQRAMFLDRLAFRDRDAQTRERAPDPLRQLVISLNEVLGSKLGLDPNGFGHITNGAVITAAREHARLMLIHGTVLRVRPDWSVPGSGKLFNQIRSNLRPDIYADPDYYVWEGSYNLGGYGREVAAKNLVQWVRSRQLLGIDVVTQSRRQCTAQGDRRELPLWERSSAERLHPRSTATGGMFAASSTIVFSNEDNRSAGEASACAGVEEV